MREMSKSSFLRDMARSVCGILAQIYENFDELVGNMPFVVVFHERVVKFVRK